MLVQGWLPQQWGSWSERTLLHLIMPALDAGIFLADEKMTGSSPVMMRDVNYASKSASSESDAMVAATFPGILSSCPPPRASLTT